MKFTPSQQQAIDTLDRNVCVSAGAGSGKTAVLVSRYLKAVVENKIQPNQILAITFTEKAANEMKVRLVETFEREGLEAERQNLEMAFIGTIHSFCATVLKEYPLEAGVHPNFTVLNEDQRSIAVDQILTDVIEELIDVETFQQLFERYGAENHEQGIRDAVFAFQAQLQRYGMPSVNALSEATGLPENWPAEKKLKVSLAALKLQCLEAKKSQTLASAQSVVEQLESFLKSQTKLPWTWQKIEALEKIVQPLQARGSLSEAVKVLHESVEGYIAGGVELLGKSWVNCFLKFYEVFETQFEAWKREQKSLDFYDLLSRTDQLFNREDAIGELVRKRHQQQFELIHVDEYQDTNLLQDRIVHRISRGNNLFIVGDVKQSIYAFQGASVDVFYKRAQEAQKKSSAKKIALQTNFRSQSSLLDWINQLFEKVWEGEPYPYEALEAFRASDKTSAVPVEFLMVSQQEDEKLEQARVNEARQLALRLHALVEEKHEIQERDGLREVRYGDMAVLFRAMTDVSIYENELREAGVPYYIVKGRGFYNKQEVRDLMNLLKLLIDPFDDYALAAVLRSPLVGISENALFWISRYADKQKKEREQRKPLFQGLWQARNFDQIGDEDFKKLDDFLRFHFELEKEEHFISVSALIRKICDRTFYEAVLLADHGGKQKYANVQKLIELARQFDLQGMTQLDEFIRYVQNLTVQEVKESEAALELEESNVVRLMTIHQAKGLEFPVVAVADLGSQVRSEQLTHFVYAPETGVGCRVKDPKGRWREGYRFLQFKEQQKAIRAGERKRLFYVALTRAKDHLILSGVLNPGDKKQEEPYAEIKTWAGWLAKAFGIQPSEPSTVHSSHASRTAVHSPLILAGEPLPIKASDEALQMTQKKAAELIQKTKFVNQAPVWLPPVPVTALMRFEKCPLSYFYRYEMGFQDEASVYDDEEKELQPVIGSEDMKATEFGTLFHKVMEHLRIDANPKDERDRIQRWLDPNLSSAVNHRIDQALNLFYQSDLYAQMQSAKMIHRELDFSLKMKHGSLRGQIDLLVESAAGEWILVDYKTSRLEHQDKQTVIQQYASQIELYALACHEILKLPISRALLFFSDDGSCADIDISEPVLQVRKEKTSAALEVMAGQTWEANVTSFCEVCGYRLFCPKQTVKVDRR